MYDLSSIMFVLIIGISACLYRFNYLVFCGSWLEGRISTRCRYLYFVVGGHKGGDR